MARWLFPLVQLKAWWPYRFAMLSWGDADLLVRGALGAVGGLLHSLSPVHPDRGGVRALKTHAKLCTGGSGRSTGRQRLSIGTSWPKTLGTTRSPCALRGNSGCVGR